MDSDPFFRTRGVVLVVRDMETPDWPRMAKEAGLTTIATHITPSEIAEFVRTDAGIVFLENCRELGIRVEHELHAMSDLLPRSLFDKDPLLFRMDENGRRVRDHNLCISSEAALSIVCENAVRYTNLLPSDTSRYFYWIDDARPMCRCPKCRHLSDTDQALVLENRMLAAIRTVVPEATLAHVVYMNTRQAPKEVTPASGLFAEFAPIERLSTVPIACRDARREGYVSHGELLDNLDANLEVFGAEDAQVLEYWLDYSRFSGWKRGNTTPLPWDRGVFLDDLDTYASRGIRHITNFATWLDADYMARFGIPPVREYGDGLSRRLR